MKPPVLEDKMNLSRQYLYDMENLAGKLTGEFASIPYEVFSGDPLQIDAAVRRLTIMKERWDTMPPEGKRGLAIVNWPAVTGRWDRKAARFKNVDVRQVYDTITKKLPEMSGKIQELIKGH
jgi:uncharacterized protein with HEPN domain